MKVTSKAKRFALSDTKIAKNSDLYNRMVLNTNYLLQLDCDRLLYHFRAYAGLDTKVENGYGGWEGEWSDIKGEFMGHYIAALGNIYLSCEETVLKQSIKCRVQYLIDSLEAVQNAIGLRTEKGYPGCFGYLAAIPTTQLDALEDLKSNGNFSDGVPYYVHHKTFKGLLHAYKVFEIDKALSMAKAMAKYFYERNKNFDRGHLDRMLNSYRYPVQYFKEFGGMYGTLIEFYELTGDEIFEALARIFDRPGFSQLLIDNRDELGYHQQHANSELPCVVGMAKHYEATGNERYKDGTLNFLHWMEEDHSFPTGGISGASAYPDYGSELFHYPKIIYNHAVSRNIHRNISSGESCCTHNLNLLSEQAFTWTLDPYYLDGFEKRFVNAVSAQQDHRTGMFLYNLNLKHASKKSFGTADDSFWCCYCSGIEAYSSLQYGAFFHTGNELWVANFIPAVLSWKEQGVEIISGTQFPRDGSIKLTIKTDYPKLLKINIRKPKWAADEVKLAVTGEITSNVSCPGGFITVEREFKNDDFIKIDFPFTLKVSHLLDRAEFVYVNYGPHLLVPVTTPDSVFSGTEDHLLKSLKSTGVPCEFYTETSSGRTVYMPISEVRNEVYNGFTVVSNPVEAEITDTVGFSSDESERLHNFSGQNSTKRCVKGTFIRETGIDGWISYSMKINPSKEMQLRCNYNGSETLHMSEADPKNAHIRLFAIQIMAENGEYKNIATQNLDKLFDTQEEYINYPIPTKYTEGKDTLNVRFLSQDFGTSKGVVGGLYRDIRMFYLSE